jgi:hypothetical protein
MGKIGFSVILLPRDANFDEALETGAVVGIHHDFDAGDLKRMD